MFKMRLVLSIVGYINLILFCYIFWNNAPQRLYGAPLAGIVVDAGTGKPIPGAYVSYLWEDATDPKGFFGSGGRTICFHAAGTVTDEAGRFHVDAWSAWSTYRVANKDPQALIYVPGYVPTTVFLHEGHVEPPVPRLHERYALQRSAGTHEQRIEALFWGFANRGCSYGGESQKRLYPMLRAIYLEARDLAQSAHQKETVDVIGELAARSAVAPNPDGPADSERLQAFVQENLK
ncbi:MAG TPA: carboxypeptidase-like regulatory domain-containing protein [Casimicrobiaceae bacterium]